MRGFALGMIALVANVAAAEPGYFSVDTAEPKEAPVVVGSTCSLMVSYEPDRHGVENRFLGDFARCGGYLGFYAAASAALAKLPQQGATFLKDGAPSFGYPFQCSIHVDFDPRTASVVQLVFTGAGACAPQQHRILAASKDSLACNVRGTVCPLSSP